LYDSEKSKRDEDILKDIEKGVRLKHVRTNDRSKPNLRGIREFRRQLTKEEKLKEGLTYEETFTESDEVEDLDQVRDDLESTKQLLELEVRSKKLLEKDNKKLQQEVVKLRQEFSKIAAGGNMDAMTESQVMARKNSIQMKRQSMIRLISESEDDDAVVPPIYNKEVIPEKEQKTSNARDSVPTTPSIHEATQQQPPPVGRAPTIEEMPQEIEEMREEVDEARRLAEEWENKYKEMQIQMTDLEMEPKMSKKHSIGAAVPPLQRLSSVASTVGAAEGITDEERNKRLEDEDEEWMLRREIHQLENKLRNTHDKREVVVRERKLLNERMENLIGNIGSEVDARKRLRKEIKEMNEAFKKEIADMCIEQQTAEELEECYYSGDEDLVANTYVQRSSDNEEGEGDEFWNQYQDENEVEETLEEIVKLAEDEDEEDDHGRELFEHYPESEEDFEEDSEADEGVVDDLLKSIVNDHEWLQKEKGAIDHDVKIDKIKKKIDRHHERVMTMRRSNYMLKSKIDRLYDILQMQKEKHHDLKLELTRMLADIQ
jgi:hypothetical protein